MIKEGHNFLSIIICRFIFETYLSFINEIIVIRLEIIDFISIDCLL
jgi:hypothetical protein